MLKRIKRIRAVKPPKDVNEFGRYLVDLTTTSEPPKVPKVTQDEVSRVMANLGARGGKIGGKRRLETMTPEQRSAVALKAARARWRKRPKKR